MKRVLWALPAATAAGLAALAPEWARPPLLAWVAGAAVLAAVVCLAARRHAWVAGLAALGVALGALVQLRLGVPPGRLAAFAAAACALFVVGVRGGRSDRLAGLLTDPYRRRLVALGALGLGVALRAVTVLGPAPASGTLPLVPVQVGELTRYLVAAGVAVAITDAGRSRREPWRAVDRRFRLLTGALAGSSVLVLVVLGDLGPATLTVLGLATALVHVRGLRPRWAAATVVGAAIAVPVLVGVSSVAAGRVREVVDPGAQLTAALTAAWSGGLVGPGPGRSPLVEGVPAIGSDYAVAALVADLGSAVVVPVLLGLVAGYVHLLRTAATRSGPGTTVAVTLSAMLAGQAGWNALGAFAVLPLTGLNQPFVGLSGASVTTSALVLGTVIGILDRAGGTRPAAGAVAIRAVAAVGTRAVTVTLVVASALLAFGHRPLDDADQLRMPRGAIWTADGRIVSQDERRQRAYPDGMLYADIGVDRWNVTHRGLDAVRADTLTCGGHLGAVERMGTLLHPTCRPADVVTTIDSRAQLAVAEALAGRSGEAVLLDARSGGVLALYSSPTTDHSSAARLRQGPPGSTMKIVTAAAALMGGVDFADAPAGAFTGPDGQRLANDGSMTCPATDAATALAYSCNSVYGWAADRIGAVELARVARTYFGADGPYLLDGLGAAGLDTGLGAATPFTAGQVARTGIGQESVRSTVLGMATATAVVANAGGGPTRWPHLTAAICAGAGPEVPAPAPVVGLPLPVEVGAAIEDGMHAAVRSGTARALAVPAGVDAAAKTGTAQLAGGGVDSWITVIVDHRYVLTLVVHRPPDDGAAVGVASRILPAIPRSDPPARCRDEGSRP